MFTIAVILINLLQRLYLHVHHSYVLNLLDPLTFSLPYMTEISVVIRQ